MCTVAKKDVLIEFLAQVQAGLARRLPLSFNEDQRKLALLRSDLYSTSHADINYEKLISEIKDIDEKYKHLPIL